jgi:hypothetical protein
MTIAVHVKDRACPDEASEDTELYGFVEAIPDTIDAEADVEERGVQPSEPQQAEELEVVYQCCLHVSCAHKGRAGCGSTYIAHQYVGA